MHNVFLGHNCSVENHKHLLHVVIPFVCHDHAAVGSQLAATDGPCIHEGPSSSTTPSQAPVLLLYLHQPLFHITSHAETNPLFPPSVLLFRWNRSSLSIDPHHTPLRPYRVFHQWNEVTVLNLGDKHK